MSIVEFDEIYSQLLRVRAELGVARVMTQRMRAVHEGVAIQDLQAVVNKLILDLVEQRGQARKQLVLI